MLRRAHKSCRCSIKRAIREGVVVRAATSQNEWKSYYEIYHDSLRRWGKRSRSSYPWDLFEEMLNRHSPHIKLWLAYLREKAIAGALCFYTKEHAVYWHGGAPSDFFSSQPVNLLMYEIVKDACTRGCWWFDFNPSHSLEGVRAFKKSFGTEALACPVVVSELDG